MKSRFIIGELTTDLLKQFFEFSEKENLKELFIDSPGGYQDVSDSIAYVVNTNPEEYHVVVSGSYHSAAFNLLLNVTCSVTVLDSAAVGIHLNNWNLETRDMKNPDSEAFFIANVVEPERMESQLKKFSFLSDEQVEKLRNGGEVFLTSKDLRKILNVESA